MNEEQQAITDLAQQTEKPAAPSLTISVKARIWGNPESGAVEPDLSPEARQDVMRNGKKRCMYCGIASEHNQIHNLNDNHADTSPANMRPACPLCHGWAHLEALADGKANLAALPGLRAEDINHLQRAIMLAMRSGNEDLRKDAEAVYEWLDNHRIHVNENFFTYDPAEFAAAINRLPADLRPNKEAVLAHLAVVFNPEKFPVSSEWLADVGKDFPVDTWEDTYKKLWHSAA